LSFEIRLFILTVERIRIDSRSVNKILYICFQVVKKQHGGKRKGAGRKPEGKIPVTVTLTEANVERAKKREMNFSALLDGLLALWLRSR
jgi:hypothetical protein